MHPDDRARVNSAFTSSVTAKTGYDIVHRLLLRGGVIKYVHERCRTEYDEQGRALRSFGTVQDITERVRSRTGFCGLISRDSRMHEIFDTIRDLAQLMVPVLIQGESGTGKELVARAIHTEGPRASGPFVPVNCGALPEGLLESELFGHVKGAFTGAIRSKKGRFELANGGTLFLDEMADLPKDLQVKLLRVLQEGEIERVGAEQSTSVDVRIISAANRNLITEVERGRFREDLYYRIKVVPIVLPPLRDRKTDIPLLAEHFLEEAAREGQPSEGISRDAVACLVDHGWPGNVRELQSAVHFALIKSRGALIHPYHLPPELATVEEPRPSAHRTVDDSPAVEHPLRPIGKPGRAPKLSQENVVDAIARSGGNKAEAARLLGVGRATLYRFLKKGNP